MLVGVRGKETKPTSASGALLAVCGDSVVSGVEPRFLSCRACTQPIELFGLEPISGSA